MATWNKVQSFSVNTEFNGGGPHLSTQLTLGSAVAVGDTINIRTTVGNDPATKTPTLTDNLGNTYTRQGSTYLSVDGQGYDDWCCIVTNAGTPTITYTPDGANGENWIGFKGDHFTGSDSSSTVRDKQAGSVQNGPGTSADAITTPSVAAQSGDLQWGSCAIQNPDATLAAGTGFTGSTIDSTLGIITEFKTATGAGAATFTDATNGGTRHYVAYSFAVTPAAAGGSVNVTPTGFALTMSRGTPSLQNSSNPTVAPTGFGLTMSLGTFTTQNDITLTGVAGFPLSFSLGTPTVQIGSSSNVTVTPPGFALTFNRGTPSVLLSGVRVSPVGFPLTMSRGTPIVHISTPGAYRKPNGLMLGTHIGIH